MADRATARAWCRVDLAGGTLDIWPLGQLHPGARTVNVAVDIAQEARLERRSAGYRVRQGDSVCEAESVEELKRHADSGLVGWVADALELPPINVELRSDSPRGAGLGGSSAMVVALIAAAERLLDRPQSEPAYVARLARDLEARLMALPTGLQDHYPALLGGVLEIGYQAGGEVVRRLDVDVDALARSLVVVYSGSSHFSAAKNWQVIRRRLDGDPESARLFDGICQASAGVSQALERDDLEQVGKWMSKEWSYRRQLASDIETPEIARLLERAARLGAWGGKGCGAGGGGSIALLCPPDRKSEIEAGVLGEGGQIVPARPTVEGLTVS